MNLKICFLAPSGYGKSTAVKILQKKYNAKNIKIAAPLYELQNNFYHFIGMDIGYKQDGELLQYLGKKIRNENKYFLLDSFKSEIRRAEKSNYSMILNDDCRPDDYDYLKDLGFIFVKINGFKRDRDDYTKSDDNNNLEWKFDEIPHDYIINNVGTIEDYEKQLDNLLFAINSKIDKCYIIPSFICDSDCWFCISKTRNFSSFPKKLMVNETFINNIDLLARRGIKKFEITGGGEPLLNNNLQDIINIIKAKIPDAYIKLYTNGNTKNHLIGINEFNISVSHYDDNKNNNIMGKEQVPLMEKLEFWHKLALNNGAKLRVSLAIQSIGINSPDALRKFIEKTDMFVDEYVVRTLYSGPITGGYVDFEYNDKRVKWERDNVTSNEMLVMSTNGLFYNSFDMDEKNYFCSYIMLKPDSAPYINEILHTIKRKGFVIKKMLLMDDFKKQAGKLYYLKHKNYYHLVLTHLELTSKLFWNKGIVILLDKDCSIEELYLDTYILKTELRNEFGLTHHLNGKIEYNSGHYQLNLAHCPEAKMEYFNKDLDIINSFELNELSEWGVTAMKLYRTYCLDEYK